MIDAGSPSDVHGVDLSITGDAAKCPGQVNRDLYHAGPGEVIDNDVVRPPERIEMEELEMVEVHRDIGDVAGE